MNEINGGCLDTYYGITKQKKEPPRCGNTEAEANNYFNRTTT